MTAVDTAPLVPVVCKAPVGDGVCECCALRIDAYLSDGIGAAAVGLVACPACSVEHGACAAHLAAARKGRAFIGEPGPRQAVPATADDHHVPRCGCEKVHRCVEDRCPKCCYCGAAWQGRESVSTPYTSSVQSEPLRTESGPNAGADYDSRILTALEHHGGLFKAVQRLLADVRRETVEACRTIALDHAEWLSEPRRVTDDERKVAVGALWTVAKMMAALRKGET